MNLAAQSLFMAIAILCSLFAIITIVVKWRKRSKVALNILCQRAALPCCAQRTLSYGQCVKKERNANIALLSYKAIVANQGIEPWSPP